MSQNDDKKSPTGTCDTCTQSDCAARTQKDGETSAEFEQRQRLQSRLCRIGKKIVVLSGKGGVGKSTVAVNLAVSLMLAGKRTGLLDVDIHGPSVPTMLGLEGIPLQGRENEIYPVERDNLKVMSIGFLLNHPDDAVIWRGPRKMGVIRQFLSDVTWGDLDVLVVDSPPGTGDEPLSVVQLLDRVDGAIIVTTPQKVAAVDVRKSIRFCRELDVPVLGIVENMNGFVCPHCEKITSIFPTGSTGTMARELEVPLLGSLPMDPRLARAADQGKSFVSEFASSPVAEVFADIVKKIMSSEGIHA